MKHTKVCTKCGVEKEINRTNFSTREGGKFRADCRECYNKFRRENYEVYAKHHMISDARRRANKKELKFNLTKDLLFPKTCPILNIKLKHGTEEWYNSPTIDRIDNTKGYTMDNVLVISALANTIKSSATPVEILKVGNFYKQLYKEKGIKYETR